MSNARYYKEKMINILKSLQNLHGFATNRRVKAQEYSVDNPIDRYGIGDRTPVLKYNDDGSLDIYIQHDSPGKDKESNWLPSPSGDFSLQMRGYYPQESILNGYYQYPPI